MRVIKALILLSLILLTNCGFYPSQCPRLRPVNVTILGTQLSQKQFVLEAIKGWNTLLDFNYFILNDYTPSLSIRTGEILKSYGFAGMFEQYPDNQNLIVIDKNLDSATVVLVTYHELGHSMGLSHIDDKSSIMYPSVIGMTAKKPSKRDVDYALDMLDKKVSKDCLRE
jgi:hypothetical protein